VGVVRGAGVRDGQHDLQLPGATTNICHLGGEIKDPERNIPRGIFLSVLGIAVLYLAMQNEHPRCCAVA